MYTLFCYYISVIGFNYLYLIVFYLIYKRDIVLHFMRRLVRFVCFIKIIFIYIYIYKFLFRFRKYVHVFVKRNL